MKNIYFRLLRYFHLLLFLQLSYINAFTQEYTFGDDMMKFVTDSVFSISRAHIQQDYPSRSLVAFQVTLDKARAATNSSISSLNQSVRLLDSIRSGVKLLLDAETNGTLISSERAARLAEYSSTVNLILNSMAYNKETVLANARALSWLNNPISYQEFKDQRLYYVPYVYIMSSITGAPDFNATISFSYTMNENGEGAGGENSINGFLSFLKFLGIKDKKEEYDEQVDKYKDAIKIIPKNIPDTQLCYDIYKNGFLFVKALFGEEPQLLRTHIDSIANEINARYLLFLDLKGTLDNGLLSDRVRQVLRSLGENHFNVTVRALIKNRLLQIKAAKENVLNNRLKILDAGQNKATIFIALEDIKEICEATDSFISETKSLMLFQPVHHLLPEQLRWFAAQRAWAETCLHAGQVPGESFAVTQELIQFSKKTGKLKAASLKQAASKTSIVTKADDPNIILSVAFNWLGGGSGAYYQSYPNAGIDIWSKNADGAFPGDGRRVGFYAGSVSINLRQRTKDLHTKYDAALGRVRQEEPARQEEIRQQAALNQTFRSQTADARTVTPPGHNPISGIMPTQTPYRDLGSQYVEPLVQLPTIINTELARQQVLINNLPGDVGSSIATKRYIELHEKYLNYAHGLWAGGYLKEAKNLLSGAQSLRSQFQGFGGQGQPLPSFEQPNIPFSPFTKDDHTLIYGRHMDYQTANNNLRSKTRWYEAAAIVTQVNGIGLTDALAFTHGYGFSLTADFLRKVNQELFQNNMLNAVKIQAGRMDGSFVDSNGEMVSFKGLSGKDLDYALVKFEQTKVEQQLDAFRRGHSITEIAIVVGQINTFMHLMNYTFILPAEVRSAMFSSFNFARYEDRVKLGQAIIDELYKKPE